MKFSGLLEATDGSASLMVSIFDYEGICRETLQYVAEKCHRSDGLDESESGA